MLKQCILVLIFLVCIYLLYSLNYQDTVYIRSSIDNNVYEIRSGNGKSRMYLQQSANTLAEINARIVRLIQHLNIKYANDHTRHHFLSQLQKRYSHTILSEAAIDNRYTTYTIDKEEMHVCLRTRDAHEKLYSTNTLMYVMLHELAHLSNYSPQGEPIQGHGKEFLEIFKLYVLEAIEIGVYTYIDYTQQPQEYCGIVISTSIV